MVILIATSWFDWKMYPATKGSVRTRGQHEPCQSLFVYNANLSPAYKICDHHTAC